MGLSLINFFSVARGRPVCHATTASASAQDKPRDPVRLWHRLYNSAYPNRRDGQEISRMDDRRKTDQAD